MFHSHMVVLVLHIIAFADKSGSRIELNWRFSGPVRHAAGSNWPGGSFFELRIGSVNWLNFPSACWWQFDSFFSRFSSAVRFGSLLRFGGSAVRRFFFLVRFSDSAVRSCLKTELENCLIRFVFFVMNCELAKAVRTTGSLCRMMTTTTQDRDRPWPDR